MVIMNDLQWAMQPYCVIYYEKFRKVMQRTEKEALKLTFNHETESLPTTKKGLPCVIHLHQFYIVMYSYKLLLCAFIMSHIILITYRYEWTKWDWVHYAGLIPYWLCYEKLLCYRSVCHIWRILRCLTFYKLHIKYLMTIFQNVLW